MNTNTHTQSHTLMPSCARFLNYSFNFRGTKAAAKLQLHLQLVSIHIHAAKWKRQHLNAIYLNLSNHYTQLPPALLPLSTLLPILIIIIVFARSSWQRLLGALPSSAAFSLAFYFSFSCCCLSYLLLPPFARLAHLNVFSWHLHRHSIRLISFSCHSQWVDESLGSLDSCSSPARVLVCGCLLLCGAATVCGEDLAAHAFF